MQSYISGVFSKPINDRDFSANNSTILTWINNSIEHSIGIELAKYKIVKQVSDYLTQLYTQSNIAKQYQLEFDI